MKKTLLITSLLAISTYSFADIKDCISAAANHDKEKELEYCSPYLKSKEYPEATAILAVATSDNKKSLDFALWYTNYYENENTLNSNNAKATYTNTLNMIGNMYYSGESGKVDKTKGLEYITKAANLGNTLAQKQLGGFYGSEGDIPKENVGTAYKWFKIADINRSEETGSSSYINTLNDFFKSKPYCVAMGEQLVAQAYIDGSAGLSKDTSKAKKYLKDAIALYKDNEPTKENLQYCPEGADKLNLESAKKQLDSL
ncbi:hypothetical protein LO80_01530 [Candidatus Francisella endociliophora]|uniref:Sel1 repeat family protein n=1 Tax=Candidatus Francisella endociliophora TaxID=653937 RepID=A0A097EMJ7_9GAMM|nr:SEL1-like repeat protein [Francisella sp. FSC1006]AIT08785.1 hypothetical protein LO80_01530 [Francisella sp. FSC1006]